MPRFGLPNGIGTASSSRVNISQNFVIDGLWSPNTDQGSGSGATVGVANANGLTVKGPSGGTTGGVSAIVGAITADNYTAFWSKNPEFAFHIKDVGGGDASSSWTMMCGLGAMPGGAFPLATTFRHIGFKLVNAAGVLTVSASMADGTTEALQTATGWGTSNFNQLHGKLSNSKFILSINGTRASAITTNIPPDITGGASLFIFANKQASQTGQPNFLLRNAECAYDAY